MSEWKTLVFSTLVLSVLCIASGCGDSATGPNDLNTEWQLVDETDGIATYWRHRPDSRQKTFRAVGTFPSEQPFAVLEAMAKSDLADFFEGVASVDTFEEDPTGRWVSRAEINLPWPLNDRELFVETHLRQDPNTYEAVLSWEDVNERYPDTAGTQKIPQHRGELRVLPLEGGRVKLTFETVGDPGRMIPASLTDTFAKSIPHYALSYMRDLMAQPEYQDYDLPLLDDPGVETHRRD